jgi:hypothetical protein
MANCKGLQLVLQLRFSHVYDAAPNVVLTRERQEPAQAAWPIWLAMLHRSMLCQLAVPMLLWCELQKRLPRHS